ncbi:hypothetical protein MMC17_005085 [Xylographa soralifera]|nr:hypothetical protein [Xylographa soralifera]
MATPPVSVTEGTELVKITALANLLSLRNGGQLEPPQRLAEYSDDIEDADGIDLDVATDCPTQLADSGQLALKKRFLDRLAELLSRRKGGYSVVSCIMQEREDLVQIKVTKNTSFTDTDKTFTKTLERLLSAMSSTTKETRALLEEELWHKMLEHYRLRLEGFVSNLKQSLDKYGAFIKDVQELLALVLVSHPITDSIEQISILVLQAWAIRKDPGSQEFLLNSAARCTSNGRLWLDICFVGRVREAYLTIVKTVDNLPSFANVSICLVPMPKKTGHKKGPGKPASLSLEETLQTLGLSLNNTTIKPVIGNKQDVRSATERFDELQKQNRDIHAEVGMTFHLIKLDDTNDVSMKYIGCSKRSCFLCHYFLKALGEFMTRGCHGKLYTGWTLPQLSGLTEDGKKQIDKTLKKMQETLTTQILSPVKAQQHVAESSVGGCGSVNGSKVPGHSLVDRYKLSKPSPHSRDFESWVRSLCLSPQLDDKPSSTQLHSFTEQSGDVSHLEIHEEQQNIVDTHAIAPLCAPGRPLNTADWLDLALVSDIFPDDPQTREDYGFALTRSFHEESKLLGLYKGLMYMDITSQQIHQWRVEGSLVVKIHEYYLRIPSTHRGGYYPWFVENQHLLDTTKIPKIAPENKLQWCMEEARSFLEPEDRSKLFADLQPGVKKDSFFLLAMTMQGAHPPPELEIYYEFGFCTCIGEYQEQRLGALYQRLFFGQRHVPDGFIELSRSQNSFKPERCTFSEFWRAYANGSLPQLFDAKGLREERLQFNHLEAFLAIAPGSAQGQPSVWTLNRFLALKEDFQAPLPVLVDYGFIHCETPLQRMELKSFYEKVLSHGDALDLNAACLRGEIFEYAIRVLGAVEPRFRMLVRNHYPLAKEAQP